MAYEPRKNPYLDAQGIPMPGQMDNATFFAREENERYLDSLSPKEREKAIARQRNFQGHMDSVNHDPNCYTHTMATLKQNNPYLDEKGYPLPGKLADADHFAQQEEERYLASLSPEERQQAIARQRNFQAHMDSANCDI